MSRDSVQLNSPPGEEVELKPEVKSSELEAGEAPPPVEVKPPKAPRGKRLKAYLRRNLQTILIVSSVFLGIIFGFILRAVHKKWTKREVMYVKFLGTIFLNCLKGITLPLIVASITAAVGSLDIRLMGKIGGRAMLYYMLSTILAVALGMTLSLSIRPGDFADKKVGDEDMDPSLIEDVVFDMMRQLFPPNVIQAALFSWQTKIETTTGPPESTTLGTGNTSTTTIDTTKKTMPTDEELRLWKIGGSFRDGINIMGLMVFSVALGVALAKLKAKGEPILRWMNSLTDATLKITNWIIWISPIGIFSLLAGEVVDIEDLAKTVKSLGAYVGTMMLGFFIHAFIVLPLLYFIFICKLPFRYLLNSFPALIMALSTSSSLATLPVTIKCLETNNKMDRRVTRFVLPIGANINMDGMALYEAVAVVFIAQLTGVELKFGRVLVYCLIATLSSVGASGIPNGAVIMTYIVLGAINLDVGYITYIIATDWILDRFSTAVNVMGDCIATAVVGKWCYKDLVKFDLEESASHAALVQMDPVEDEEAPTVANSVTAEPPKETKDVEKQGGMA